MRTLPVLAILACACVQAAVPPASGANRQPPGRNGAKPLPVPSVEQTPFSKSCTMTPGIRGSMRACHIDWQPMPADALRQTVVGAAGSTPRNAPAGIEARPPG
ncbi:hypothetical protein [Noviherbaspirillum sp.]|uniref:hypothetical protein n=1 Tax=Noviherbaspirillum sp. TaxID=1926288 RepID=UPI0025EB59E9|nr:hypothetical protein [Noviherbaspirillum sp.]